MDSSNLGRKMTEAFVQATATGATKVTTWSPVKKLSGFQLRPAHLKTVIHLLESCPSPWRPFCLEKFLRVQVPLGCVKTAFLTQGLGSREFVKNFCVLRSTCMQDKCHTSSVSMSDTFSKLIVGLTAAARPSILCFFDPLVEVARAGCRCKRFRQPSANDLMTCVSGSL